MARGTDALIVDAVRSPVGKKNGTLSHIRGDELSAQIVNGLVARNDVDPAQIEDLQWGCVTQIEEQAWNIGRNVALTAGWPVSVCGTTVDRQCGSSMQTNFNAAAAVWSGPARPRDLRRRRDDVARPDGLEPRLDVGSRHRPLRHRHAGHLGRGDREGVEALARGARSVLLRVACARGPRARRRAVREGDHPGRGRRARGWRRRDGDADPHALRRRRGDSRDDAREDGAAPAGVHPRRRRDGRELVADRRRLGRGADRLRAEGRRARPRSRARVSSASASPASTRT